MSVGVVGGCAYENRPGTHNPLFRWSCTVLQNVFTGFIARFEVDVNLVEYLWVFIYMCICVSVVFSFVCSVCVYVCVLKRLIHACGDNV